MSDMRAMSDHIPAITLGWRLRMSIEMAGIKVIDLADEIGVTRGTIARWTHDDGTPPRDGFVRLIALRTGVPYEWIRYGTETADTDPDQGIQHSTCMADIVPIRARQAAAPALAAAA